MPVSAPTQASSPRIAALLLAAGLSERMGQTNKLLADIGGEAMVRRMARLYAGCGLPLYVVTGHEREKVEAALAGLPAHFIHNSRYREGQQGSVRAGLAEIGTGHDAALVGLGDQPALETSDIEALLGAFAASSGERFLVPHFGGKRGNPVMIPKALIPRILASTAQDGPLTNAAPEMVAVFDARNDHYLLDIDTEEALAHFRREAP